ncbi:MAG: ATP-dependent sacrificial sulfur transferase LarE [Endomicrobium sp.]|jgi:uncharacterized protein|nr:ATP-dependent sacrificial sulfur transferase LarE [Endomicrobium sp.]
MKLYRKYETLKQYILTLDKLIIAFSGGVDSTFLLKIAHNILGNNIIAVTAKSCSFPQRELNEAILFCKKENIRHIICKSKGIYIRNFLNNPTNRCYLCKKELFSKIWSIAKETNIKNIAEASNFDDNNDYRPGLKAISEENIKSPLMYAKLTKNEIRQLSKELHLQTWNKQSFACLFSRFPYKEKITLKHIYMIEKAEQILIDMGFKQIRVRYHKNLARIETDELGFNILLKHNNRKFIYQQFKKIGFLYVAIDIIGYRTGSMDESLNLISDIDN